MFIIKHIFCGLLIILVISDSSSATVLICGKSLTQFLEMVCVNGFNSKNLKAKKSVPAIDFNDVLQDNDIQPSEYSSILMDKLNADYNSLMAKTRRRRYDGVAEECCRKPCAMSELLSYCL